MTAFEKALASMNRRVPHALRRMIAREADALRLAPMRELGDALYGNRFGPRPMTLMVYLRDAELSHASEVARGRSGHWTHDFNRLIALAGLVVELRRRLARAGGRYAYRVWKERGEWEGGLAT